MNTTYAAPAPVSPPVQHRPVLPAVALLVAAAALALSMITMTIVKNDVGSIAPQAPTVTSQSLASVPAGRTAGRHLDDCGHPITRGVWPACDVVVPADNPTRADTPSGDAPAIARAPSGPPGGSSPASPLSAGEVGSAIPMGKGMFANSLPYRRRRPAAHLRPNHSPPAISMLWADPQRKRQNDLGGEGHEGRRHGAYGVITCHERSAVDHVTLPVDQVSPQSLPPQAVRRIMLRDQRSVLVRPVDSSDGAALATAFRRLSGDSQRSRFGSAPRTLGTAALRHLVDSVDKVDHVAFAAFAAFADDEPERLVGVARILRYPEDPQSLDVGVTVADDYQSSGLGTILASLLADHRPRPARRVVTQIADWNHRAMSLLTAFGPPQRAEDGRLFIDLDDSGAEHDSHPGGPDHDAPRLPRRPTFLDGDIPPVSSGESSPPIGGIGELSPAQRPSYRPNRHQSLPDQVRQSAWTICCHRHRPVRCPGCAAVHHVPEHRIHGGPGTGEVRKPGELHQLSRQPPLPRPTNKYPENSAVSTATVRSARALAARAEQALAAQSRSPPYGPVSGGIQPRAMAPWASSVQGMGSLMTRTSCNGTSSPAMCSSRRPNSATPRKLIDFDSSSTNAAIAVLNGAWFRLPTGYCRRMPSNEQSPTGPTRAVGPHRPAPSAGRRCARGDSRHRLRTGQVRVGLVGVGSRRGAGGAGRRAGRTGSGQCVIGSQSTSTTVRVW